jgi:hypothetical protein
VSTYQAIYAVAGKVNLVLDDNAVHKLVRRCQAEDESATISEIAYFLEVKINQLRGRRDIANWPGMLLQAVPAYFTSEKTELLRYRQEKVRERAELRRQAQSLIDDPQATEQDHELAQKVLEDSS